MLQLIIALLKLTFENKNYFEKVYSLSATVRQDKRIFPAVYKTKDEFAEINLENSAIYFRKTGDVRRRTEEGEGRGGCEDMVFITIPLRAVAHAPKSIFNTDNNFIDDKLSQNIANIISQASYNQLRSAFNAERVHCNIRSVSDDKYKVWEAEFKNIDIAARQDHVLCAVDFDIEIEISSDCLINFECDDVEVNVEDNEIVVTVTDATAWHKTGNSLTETGKFGSTNNFGYDFIMAGSPIWHWTTDGHLVPEGERNIGTQDNPVNELWVNTLHYNIPVPNVIQSLNGQTDNDQFFGLGTNGTDVNIVSSAGTHTFNFPSASATARGLVTIAAQTFAGTKTFRGLSAVSGNAIVVENWNGAVATNLYNIENVGRHRYGSQNVYIYPSANGSTVSLVGRGLVFDTLVSSQDAPAFTFTGGNGNTAAGNQYGFGINMAFTPGSGSKNFSAAKILINVTQSGGANGNVNALEIDPTLSALNGYFAAIRVKRGNIVFENLPTSATGLQAGSLWNDGGTIKIV